ncbi:MULTISPECIES: hypothetical protein [Arthrobacter]|uniref:hypothetical protein n=1 Tax=Arthrobacter TaxID=1663 RepID=UPI002782D502|nr:hypothetical protein [Arthrobacter bambusae]MDQ0241495.1 hypothetical protein [Arthrobacter bambusae]
MRIAPLLVLAIVGIFVILIRNFYARFIASIAVQVPALKPYEAWILRWMPRISVGFGLLFIAIGILMGLNLIFPDPRS